MTKKNFVEDMFVPGMVIAGILGVLTGLLLGNTTSSKPVVSDKSVSLADVDYEQRIVNGRWVYHVFYEDNEFEYETSGATLEEALRAMNSMVNI